MDTMSTPSQPTSCPASAIESPHRSPTLGIGPLELGPWTRKPSSRYDGQLAAVAELADAHDSGSCARKGVVVRLHSAALISNQEIQGTGFTGAESPANRVEQH